MNIVFLEKLSLGSDIDLTMFEEFGNVTYYDLTSKAEVASRIKDADIIIANKAPMNEETLKDALNLKLICLTATGTNNIDFEYTNSRGIEVKNVKGYSTMSVAQHTFALLFYLYEKLNKYDSYVKEGNYCLSPLFSVFDYPFYELDNKTWGIVGLGAIGRKVATIAKAFGCNVIYYSTTGKNDDSEFKRVDFEELLCESDIISIHAPLTDDTLNLFGEKEFKLMKKTAFLINVGRGPIVNEQALYDALVNDEIMAAGLDVLVTEPMCKENPLLQIKDSSKLIITPHIGWATFEARSRCVKNTYENVAEFIKVC